MFGLTLFHSLMRDEKKRVFKLFRYTKNYLTSVWISVRISHFVESCCEYVMVVWLEGISGANASAVFTLFGGDNQASEKIIMEQSKEME